MARIATVVAAAALLALLSSPGSGRGTDSSTDSSASAAVERAPRPGIVHRWIPFGLKRKREMRRYARRHYGINRYHLIHPHVIVEHYTGNNSFSATYDTFAADRRDAELHELPGVCAHYVLTPGGRIYQLVSTRIMCRHTVGLNWTAIGIEHVGTSDRQVMGRRRQLRRSLALTRWLQDSYGIRTGDVIGHSESLQSPYHRERVKRLRRQTHADFSHRTMQRYRRMLSRR